ncbi:MAG TPA: DUF2339 domain-containing protein [Terriglobia bacterium]|nr:DUF2339 domain-containing protein [Terriglobia bacterium]
MEFFVLLILLVVLLLLAVPIIAWVRASKAARVAKEDQDQVRSLTARVFELEGEVRLLKNLLVQTRPGAPVVDVAGQVATKEFKPAPEPGIITETPPAAAAPPPVTPPPPSVAAEAKAPTPAAGIGAHARPSMARRFFAGELEETLGTNWLNKLGIIILVIGVALFIGYQLRTLGPAGKDIVGIVVAAAMLGAGIWYERREQWKILARAGIGGGWALAFFVAYAMRHVQAARVLDSNAWDLVLLLLVGAGMVAHTLKYRSQTVTGLAFLLAFLTVNANRGDLAGLSGNVVLVIAIALIAVRLQWYELEVFGILAAFLTHYYWLRPIIQPLPQPHGEFPGYRLSSALLAFYWLAFLASYVVRQTGKRREEIVSAAAIILNSGLFVWLMGYQSAHPEKAFQFFLMSGAVEFAVGQLPVTRRRSAFVLLTLIGTGLMATAVPFKFSHQSLSVLWLLQAEILFLAGVYLREVVFRRLGMAVAFLAAGQILIADTRQVMDAGIALPHLAIPYFLGALILYFNAHVAPRRWPELAGHKIDASAFRIASYVAAPLAVFGVWVACSDPWTAVGWAAFGLALVYSGFCWKVREVSIEANCLAAFVILRCLFVNLADLSHWHGVPLRPVTVSLVAVLLYVSSRWALGFETFSRRLSERIPAAYTWLGSMLAALLLWYQLQPIGVAIGWMLLGLALFEIGMWRHSGPLRWQAYVAYLASFSRIFFVNLNAEGAAGALSPRVYTVLPLALAFYYVYDRLENSQVDFLSSDRKFNVSTFLNYMGILSLASLVRFEFDADWVIVGWAALTLALFALAWRTGRRIFLHQGLLLSFAILFRGIAHNLYERSYFPAPLWSWYSRPLCVGVSIALLLAALMFAFRLRRKEESGEKPQGIIARLFDLLGRRPEQVLFFVSVILLTVLLAIEMRSGMVTVAWGAESVAVFLFALACGERSFRLSGLGLLLLCAGKIIVFDFWEMTTPDKILTALVVGSALYGVSYLYTRYRETLRQYL